MAFTGMHPCSGETTPALRVTSISQSNEEALSFKALLMAKMAQDGNESDGFALVPTLICLGLVDETWGEGKVQNKADSYR